MRKTFIYLATLSALTFSGVTVFNSVDQHAFGTVVAHAGSGSWLLLKPLDPEAAKYVQPTPIDGLALTDAGQALYNNPYNSKTLRIFYIAPYVREEGQVSQSDFDTSDGLVGQIGTSTFTPKDSSMPTINVDITHIYGDTGPGVKTIPGYISEIENDFATHNDESNVDVQQKLEMLQFGRALELGGVIPSDSKTQSTIDIINGTDSAGSTATKSNESAATSSSSSANASSATGSTTATSKSHQKKLKAAEQKVHKLQATLKKAAKNLKKPHQSKRDKQLAKQKYRDAKAALKSAKHHLARVEA